MSAGSTIRLKGIRVYPLKGAGGMNLPEMTPDSFGIPGDRRWMLVRPDGLFISQRTHPRLALLRVMVAGGGGTGVGGGPEGRSGMGELEGGKGRTGVFSVEIPGRKPFSLVPPETPEWMNVQVHRDRFSALAGYGEVDEWFSSFLGDPCRLAYLPEEILRPVDSAWAPGHRVSLADGFPLLLTAEASLKDLNRRLDSPSGMLRFRPNLVVEGAEPWEEDLWRSVRIGGALLDLVKPCARCSVVSVDQGTGNRGVEPLKTLRAFRGREGKTYFGQNGVFRRVGSLRVGDDVHILERGEARPPLPVGRPG